MSAEALRAEVSKGKPIHTARKRVKKIYIYTLCVFFAIVLGKCSVGSFDAKYRKQNTMLEHS